MLECAFACIYLSRISFGTAVAPSKVCLSVAQVASLNLSALSPLLLPTRDSSVPHRSIMSTREHSAHTCTFSGCWVSSAY